MIQEFKDEVLDTNLQPDVEPRYTIRDNAGNVLNDNVKIELKTPVIENGTPLNKATMGNIQGDLYTSDRYNKPVVSKESVGQLEETKTGDIIPKTWTKVSDYQYKADGVTLTCDSVYSTSSYYLYYACDGETGTQYRGENSEYNAYRHIKWIFDTPKKITKMYVYIGTQTSNYMTSDYVSITIQGSNNDSTWTDLFSVPISKVDEYKQEIELSNTDYYKYYRIYAYMQENGLNVYEWYVTEYAEIEMQYIYVNNLSLPLTSYEVGKIVRIKGSSYTETQEVTKTGNIFPTSGWNEEVSKTKYSSNGWVIESNSAEYSVDRVSDNDTSTNWHSLDGTTHWIKMTCPEPQKITKMAYNIYMNAYNLTKIAIQGSKDDDVWVDLGTPSTSTENLTEITLSNTDFYKYYRIYITFSLNSLITMYEWQVSEYIEIEEGVEITSFENLYININNLGVMPIKGTVYKNNYYNLVFDGTQFLLESTRIDVTNATILATTSGTYTLNPDITYDVVAIGGGGGSWMDTDDCRSYGGGSGGYVTGTISDTSSISVTIGAGGTNVCYYRPWNHNAGDGGTTKVGSLTAYGGTGAGALGPAGTGGGYAGGTGQQGTNGNGLGSTASGYINGPTPTGWNLNGTKGGMYGAGGQMESEGGYDGGSTIYHGQNGVVAFIPQV